MDTMTVQLRRNGVITLPVALRRQYDLNAGDVFTLVDLGNGSFMLTPRVSQAARLADRVAQLVAEEGVNLEEMLEVLDQERERYYQDHYAQP